ncbi:non-ribosomal peptide synthetase, partial [Amycolatopsis rhizosphaerae]
RWFLDQDLPAPGHYNQDLLLGVREPLAPEALEKALKAIVTHHDALRLRLGRDGSGDRSLGNAAPDDLPDRILTVADFSRLSRAEGVAAFERLAAETQASGDLASGCLLRAVYARLGAAGDRLLLIIHHLGVDGVSWRVLLEDLTTAYGQAAEGTGQIRLPGKTTAFRTWARRLEEYAVSGGPDTEIPYWTSILTGADAAVPTDSEVDVHAANTYGAAKSVTVSLTRESTDELLRSGRQASAQEILLTALGRTLTSWTGRRCAVVEVEGHGRESRWDDVDVSRTVGWFTTLYPVALAVTAEDAPGDALRRVRDHLATVPGNGLGYGLLRHTAAAPLRALPIPRVRYNYLGRVTGDGPAEGLFTAAPESAGPPADPRGRRPYLLDVSALVADGQLRVSLIFCPAVHRHETVEKLAVALLDEIHVLLSPAQKTGYTPADFPLAQLDQAQLDAIAGMLDQD